MARAVNARCVVFSLIDLILSNTILLLNRMQIDVLSFYRYTSFYV